MSLYRLRISLAESRIKRGILFRLVINYDYCCKLFCVVKNKWLSLFGKMNRIMKTRFIDNETLKVVKELNLNVVITPNIFVVLDDVYYHVMDVIVNFDNNVTTATIEKEDRDLLELLNK